MDERCYFECVHMTRPYAGVLKVVFAKSNNAARALCMLTLAMLAKFSLAAYAAPILTCAAML